MNGFTNMTNGFKKGRDLCEHSMFTNRVWETSDWDMNTTLISRVKGLANKVNDVIYKAPKDLVSSHVKRHVICFFGGDIQDLRPIMQNNDKHKELIDYSLENTANLLSEKYTSSHVFVIRANRFQDKTFAIYDNFVDSDSFGIPKHQFTKNSLSHLRLVLINCLSLLNLNLSFDNIEKFVLIGFSKGCVVLNQFLYSFYVSSEDQELKSLISRIECMNWCDGGHSGGSNTWITGQEVLKHFSKLSIKVHINVTPRQVMCRYRPWIGNEEKIFFNTLTQLGTNVQRILHFEGEEDSLEMHFRVLKHFQ